MRCNHEVTRIVSLPYLEGDVYCVCEKHIAWALGRCGKRARSRPNDHREIASGCVYTDETAWRHPSAKHFGEAQLKRRMAVKT